MALEAVLSLESGDFGGPVRDALSHMEGRYCFSAASDRAGDVTCDQYILDIAASMEANGWEGPPVCVRHDPPAYWRPVDGEWLPTLVDGHHRTMAAVLAGVQRVPVTASRDLSSGDIGPDLED